MAWFTSTLVRLRAALFGPGGPGPEAGHGVLQGIMPWGQAPRRGTRELLQAYARLPFLHSILRRICEDVASTQWRLYAPGAKPKERGWYRAMARTATEPMHAERRARTLRQAVEEGALREVYDHPFLNLLNEMNPALGGFDSWYVSQLHLELVGQAPLVRDNNPAGLPVALWPVAPHWVIQTPSMVHPYYRVSWNAWYREIPETELLWQRIPDPENPYARGTSFGPAVSDELDVIELRARYAKNFFFNDGTPAAIIYAENAAEPEVNRLRADLENRHRGPGKNGLNYVTNRKIGYQQLQPPMKDLQYAEQTESGRDLLLEVFQIPRELVGLRDGSNRATISAATYLYARGVLVPRIERRRAFLQPLLDEYTKDSEGAVKGGLILGYDSPVPEDAEGERAYMMAVPTAFTLNEHRAQGGKEPRPGPEGDELFTPPAAASPLGFSVGRADPPWTLSAGERERRRTISEGLHLLADPLERQHLPRLRDRRGGKNGVRLESTPRASPFSPCNHADLEGWENCDDIPVVCVDCRKSLGCHFEAQPFWCTTCAALHAGKKEMRPPLTMAVYRAVTDALEALRPEALAEEVGPVEEEGFKEWADEALSGVGVSISFDMKNPKVKEVLALHAADHVAQINDTTKQALKEELAASAAAGEGVREARKRVEAVFEEAAGYRAEMIARTELVGLSNAANLQAWEQSGVVDGKEWLAVRDGATREAHQELDGQQVELDEPFRTSDGHTAQHPGGFGVAALDVNCRCTGLPVVKPAERAVRRAVALTEEQKVAAWKAFDKRLSTWERALVEALRRAFDKQKEAVLAAL